VPRASAFWGGPDNAIADFRLTAPQICPLCWFCCVRVLPGGKFRGGTAGRGGECDFLIASTMPLTSKLGCDRDATENSRWKNPQITSIDLPSDSDAATYQTVNQMERLVYGPGGVRSAEVREAALDAVRGVARGQGELDALFNYVRSKIEFRGEFSESLQEPRVTLQLGAGDCDDHAMLLAAMAISVGFRARFRTVALASDPSHFSHVFVEVQDKRTKQWQALDTTVANGYAGWTPPNVTRNKNYRAMSATGPDGMPMIVELAISAAAMWVAKQIFGKKR
jgi:hypothetical protein